MTRVPLLSIGADAKTVKGIKINVKTGILYLAPAEIAGRGNVCPHASAGCRAACLYTAGRAGIFAAIPEARIRKTREYFENPAAFLARLEAEIAKLQKSAERAGMVPAVRLDGTSDLGLARHFLAKFPRVKFYDYTKNPVRMRAFLRSRPENYHLTFSRSETNERECVEFLNMGGNVSVVFSGELPATWNGFPVINGDETDVRFQDATGCVVGLTAKGAARRDSTGFVVR